VLAERLKKDELAKNAERHANFIKIVLFIGIAACVTGIIISSLMRQAPNDSFPRKDRAYQIFCLPYQEETPP